MQKRLRHLVPLQLYTYARARAGGRPEAQRHLNTNTHPQMHYTYKQRHIQMDTHARREALQKARQVGKARWLRTEGKDVNGRSSGGCIACNKLGRHVGELRLRPPNKPASSTCHVVCEHNIQSSRKIKKNSVRRRIPQKDKGQFRKIRDYCRKMKDVPMSRC